MYEYKQCDEGPLPIFTHWSRLQRRHTGARGRRPERPGCALLRMAKVSATQSVWHQDGEAVEAARLAGPALGAQPGPLGGLASLVCQCVTLPSQALSLTDSGTGIPESSKAQQTTGHFGSSGRPLLSARRWRCWMFPEPAHKPRKHCCRHHSVGLRSSRLVVMQQSCLVRSTAQFQGAPTQQLSPDTFTITTGRFTPELGRTAAHGKAVATPHPAAAT